MNEVRLFLRLTTYIVFFFFSSFKVIHNKKDGSWFDRWSVFSRFCPCGMHTCPLLVIYWGIAMKHLLFTHSGATWLHALVRMEYSDSESLFSAFFWAICFSSLSLGVLAIVILHLHLHFFYIFMYVNEINFPFIHFKERGPIRFMWVVLGSFVLIKFDHKKTTFDRWWTASHGNSRRWSKEANSQRWRKDANQQAIAWRGKEFSTTTENVLQLLLPSMFGWKGVVLYNKIWSSTICKFPCFDLSHL